MKKILFLCLFLSGILRNEQNKAQFIARIKGDINYASLSIINKQAFRESKLNTDGILGYNIGVFARVGNKIYIQPEIYVSTQESLI